MATMKEIRQQILQLLHETLDGQIKSWWTGYPFYIEVRHTPFVAVFSEAENSNWIGQRQYQTIYELTIMVGMDARQEIESRDRGIQNEDWLNDIGEQILQTIYEKAYKIDSAILQGDINLDYRNGGGNIRTLNMTLRYTDRKVINI